MQLSLDELRELTNRDRGTGCPEDDPWSPWISGKSYLIRTVTMTLAGRLKQVGKQELVLENAVWIADTGRFHDCLKNPDVIKEAEPFVNDCIVGRGAIVDATEWIDVEVSQK